MTHVPSSIALVTLLLLALPRPGLGQDSRLTFSTIETPHFAVHFHSGEYPLASRAARLAEEAHRLLAPRLRWTPQERCQIVLTDDTDSANGWAMVIPRNLIHLFAATPETFGTLNDYEDWLLGLIVHEYTHILHMDTMSGPPAWINAIFGKMMAPNGVNPTWLVEGLAVMEESYLTSSGRHRSSLYDMYLRMPVLEGRFHSLDQMTGSPEPWPHGTIAYLYGASFIRYIAQTQGEEALTHISHIYGSNLIPFGINTAATEAMGQDYIELHKGWVQSLRRRYRQQAREVRLRGETPTIRLTRLGEMNLHPRFTPDGEAIIFASNDGRTQRAIRRVDLRSLKVETLHNLDAGVSGLDLSGHGRHAYLSQSTNFRGLYGFDDIYRLDLASGERVRLTRGARVRELSLWGDHTLAFTNLRTGASDLATLELSDATVPCDRDEGTLRGENACSTAPLVVAEGMDASEPAWSPDGRHIAFTAWSPGGFRDIALLNVSTGQITRLTHDRAQDMGPTWTKDGQHVLFSSDRTGITNIYAVHVHTRRVVQITNLIGGAYQPTLSPDGRSLAFVGYSSDGYDIHLTKMPQALAALPPAPPDQGGRPAPADVNDDDVYPVHAYNPLDTLWPLTWLPLVGQDARGTTLGLLTSGGDVVGHHAWLLTLEVGLTQGDPLFSASYRLGRFFPTLYLNAARTTYPGPGYAINGQYRDYLEDNWSASASVAFPFSFAGYTNEISLSYGFELMRALDPLVLDYEPDGLLPWLPELGLISGVNLAWFFSNTRATARSISPEEGRTISLTLSLDHRALGSDYNILQLVLHWREYLTMPWLTNHVLALALHAGTGTGDMLYRRIFYLGGMPKADILMDLLSLQSGGGQYLHGYEPYALGGSHFVLGQASYRFPLYTIDRGISTLPLFLSRLYGQAYIDLATAGEDLDAGDLKVGVGAEVSLDMMLGYGLPATVRLGLARGLMEGGMTNYYLVLGKAF